MLFKSLMLQQASGSLAGTTFSHNAGGQYTRNRSIPTNPNTSQQAAIRNAVKALSTAYVQTLTNAQRLAWKTYAMNVSVMNALGSSINLSAISMYVRSNVPRLQVGISRVDDAPTTFDLGTFTAPVPTISAAGTTVSVAFTAADSWANATGNSMLVYASRPQNASIGFFKGPYRFAGRINGGISPPSSPAVITLPFPSGPTGSQQFFKFSVSRLDGRLSSSFLVGSIAP